jgi:hypothetical protein
MAINQIVPITAALQRRKGLIDALFNATRRRTITVSLNFLFAKFKGRYIYYI